MEVHGGLGILWLRGSALKTESHRHHAIQVTLGFGNPLFCKTAHAENHSNSFIIGKNCEHQLNGENWMIILIEPESHLGQTLTHTFDLINHDLQLLNLDQSKIQSYKSIAESASMDRFFIELVGTTCMKRHGDERISKVLKWIDEHIKNETTTDISFTEAQDLACLSESRFLHLFSEQIGLPWRTYLLWRKLFTVLNVLKNGYSLTRAAHQGGFSDSAHFSRTFKRMFGVTPKKILHNSRYIQEFLSN